jgi:hypothetical protein
MKKKLYLIITILFLTINIVHPNPPCPATQPSPILKTLTDDLALYKTTNSDHEGHLIAHSIWTARTIDKWFTQDKFWTEGIDSKHHKTAVWAGFLHDVGKAGHFRSPYHLIPEHPSIGFHYLAGFTSNKLTHFEKASNFTYQLTPPDIGQQFINNYSALPTMPKNTLQKMVGKSKVEIYSFKELFKELKFSQEEQNIISILSGIHWDFGHVMQHNASQASIKDYFEKLQELVSLTNYNNKIIDDKIVRLAILITAADARSSGSEGLCIVSDIMLNHPSIAYDQHKGYNSKSPDLINWENNTSKRSPAFSSFYKTYNYETKGKDAREKVIEYYKKNYASSEEESELISIKNLLIELKEKLVDLLNKLRKLTA